MELKNGETVNGHLVNIDGWMNLNLKSVTRTSRSGDKFWSHTELFVRGNTVKYLRVPEKVADIAADNERNAQNRAKNRRQRGKDHRSRGRGGGGRRYNNHNRNQHQHQNNRNSRYDSD